jgi:NMT1-like family
MKLRLVYRRRWWLFYLPLLVGVTAAAWWSATRWKVLPPDQVLISAGSQEGSYSRLAQRYAEKLARRGLRAELVYSDGDQTPLKNPAAAGDAAVIGFARGGDANPGTPAQALAVVGQEPIWIFSRKTALTSLSQAAGLRVAAGTAASATGMAAKLMLQSAGIRAADITSEPLAGLAAVNALIDDKVDLVFLAAGEDSPALQLLLKQGSFQLLGVERSGALTAQAPHLRALLLPQGGIEFRGDIPPRDLTLMALQTHLMVREDAHPALQRLLLDVAVEIHEFPNFLQRQGEFPSFHASDFPLSPTAKGYGRGERPWMETLLPYGKAQQAELLIFAILPILVITSFAMTWIPRLFDWRVSARLNHFYGKLKFLEDEVEQAASDQPMALKGLLERLDHLEGQVVELDLPDEFSDRWYTLREHLAATRERLLTLRSR